MAARSCSIDLAFEHIAAPDQPPIVSVIFSLFFSGNAVIQGCGHWFLCRGVGMPGACSVGSVQGRDAGEFQPPCVPGWALYLREFLSHPYHEHVALLLCTRSHGSISTTSFISIIWRKIREVAVQLRNMSLFFLAVLQACLLCSCGTVRNAPASGVDHIC